VCRYTGSIHKIRDLSWVSVQRRDVRLLLFVPRGPQTVCHFSLSLSLSWLGILRLGVGEVAQKHMFVSCLFNLVHLMVHCCNIVCTIWGICPIFTLSQRKILRLMYIVNCPDCLKHYQTGEKNARTHVTEVNAVNIVVRPVYIYRGGSCHALFRF
jgi:hypothetical protein